MSDERLERLTELARKAWPAVLHARVRAAYADRHEVTVETADYHRMRLMVDHPRALDALESALRVLAGEYASFVPAHRYLEAAGERDAANTRANAAEARLAAVQEKISEWRSYARELEYAEGGGVRGAIEDMADELTDALEKTP